MGLFFQTFHKFLVFAIPKIVKNWPLFRVKALKMGTFFVKMTLKDGYGFRQNAWVHVESCDDIASKPEFDQVNFRQVNTFTVKTKQNKTNKQGKKRKKKFLFL